MKLFIKFILLAFWTFPLILSAQQEIPSHHPQQLLNKSNHNFFIENKGQWPKEVRYLARIGGMNAWITQTGVVYDYYKITRNYKPEETLKLQPQEKDDFEREHTSIKGHVVDMLLEGANTQAKSLPSGMQEGYYNYFIGNDSTKWASFVRLYSEVLIQDVYPGIDIRYYFDNNLIRYDYIANAGADLAQINLKIIGSDGYKINDKGELTIKTSLGNITHGKLFAYQNIGNHKAEISCSFIKTKNGHIGVYAENYNPALALVIDPLVYSTFIGGSGDDQANSIAIDSSGNAFVTGHTSSSNYPTTAGAYDVSYNNSTDVFITKLSASGSVLVYSTFIGGSSYDEGYSIGIDNIGNAYVCGITSSTNYPTTTGAYDLIQNGNYDIFMTKLNASGSALVYSTYIGGKNEDRCCSIIIDSSGNAYITGYTQSPDYPTTTGAYDVSYNGLQDVIVTKLNASGSALIYSTFIGTTDSETANALTIDKQGNAYITGIPSSTYPTTFGAYDVSFNGGTFDVFVTKLNSLGSALIYSTFIGGSGLDISSSIAIDSSRNVFITGRTYSNNYPITAGAYDVSYNGNYDVFVTKLNASGSALIYSTFIGGTISDEANSIAVDINGNALITGFTSSSNFPATPGAYDVSYNGNYDVFVTKLNASGSALTYSTFIGGSSTDEAYSIAIDDNRNVFITGTTTSNDYLNTTGAYDVSYNGSNDAFITKFLLIDQARNLRITNVTTTQASCKWTKGGGIKRAVFVIQSNTGIALPINHTAYIANDTFGKGSQLGSSGWFCVYNDTGSSIIIKELKPNTCYRVAVCEYVGKTGFEYYVTDSTIGNPRNFLTLSVIQAQQINFSNFATNSFTASWINGNCPLRVVFVCATDTGTAYPSNNTTYRADTIFGSGTQIGSTGWYCVYNGSGNSVNISGLKTNIKYRMMVCEYYGDLSQEQYIISTATLNPRNYYLPIPSIQATNIVFSNVSQSSMDISWTNGNGSRRAVFMRVADTGTVSPKHYTIYSANSVFGSGSQVGNSGWYCVANGTATMASVTGLTVNTTYRVMVCEYLGNSSNLTYNMSPAINNPSNQTPGYNVPTTQASGIIFSNITTKSLSAKWTNGNGTARIVFIKAGSSGSAAPFNINSYTADTVFGSGSQLGSTGWYCVYKNTGNSVNISNLSQNTVYRLMVCEFHGAPGFENYNITNSTNNPANILTDCIVPLTQSSGISFNHITATSFRASWTKGSGSTRAVFVKSAYTGSAVPVNSNAYIADTNYSLGTQIGNTDWFCVYNDTGTSTNISSLSSHTIYRVMVCEYNGAAGNEKYNISNSTKNPANVSTDYEAPLSQSENITFSAINKTSFTASWTKGNGSSRIVFICAGNSGSAVPLNTTTYSADTSFGSGTQIGSSGWYCVYNGNRKTVNIGNLTPYTTYRVMVCEYNGTTGSEQYNTNTTTNNPANQITDFIKPTIQASNINFSNISSSSADIKYNRGNGSACLVLVTNGTNLSPPLQDNTSYSPSSQVGSSDWYCKYNGAADSTSLTGLTPATFRIMVCEYNGTAGLEKYLTDTATLNPNSFNAVGNHGQVKPKINIYPNPSNGQLVIENAKGYHLTIFNTLGKSVYNSFIPDNSYTAELNNVSDGIYFLKLEGNSCSVCQKIVLRR